MLSFGLVPRKRLINIPPELRAKHEYCYFLHDECVRVLREYEKAEAHIVKVKFPSKITAQAFSRLAETDAIEALKETGFANEARHAMLNTITMAMVSDCLHHIYEALSCFEKRKVIVAMNLLRKPLKDSLVYLAWILGDEAGFYREFTSGNPENISQKKLGNLRTEIFSKAISQTGTPEIFDASILLALLFDKTHQHSLEKYFQHAVHLVTIKQAELRTSPQNFNFIFKSYADDDLYVRVYDWLPYILLFMAETVMELFNRMQEMDEGARLAFVVRAVFGYSLITAAGKAAQNILRDILSDEIGCGHCNSKLKMTPYNAARILMTESFRCTSCRRVISLPFSYLF